ncbi:M6 family metalloprotease domain-containing protein [Streptomyces sp. BHT-5-2]|uniref:M6 family metalloprotease domain-containing protein n=1 Tax=unclassified Streptomyces TaxID=2593676 RepID=UPI001C8EAB96|nr:M6 family metalloprotease domain-containing protein [Streptomyces sp. BHT-5-2]QZL02461.1 M6 family metalloprotease domain-containing protein [Streptomyces sp. BHT-5-2]
MRTLTHKICAALAATAACAAAGTTLAAPHAATAAPPPPPPPAPIAPVPPALGVKPLPPPTGTAGAGKPTVVRPGAPRPPTGTSPSGPCALHGITDDVSEAAPTPAGFAHGAGTVRALTLFVDFPDAPAGLSPMARYAEFFPAVTDYFRTSSYGRLTYVPKPLFRWIRMSHPLAAYGITRNASFDPSSDRGYHALSQELVHAVDPYVDFRNYDVVNVITAPNAGPAATDSVLSVTFSGSDLGLKTARGAPLRNVSFIWSRQTGLSAFRVLNHENAHSFGLPDLYYTDERSGSTPVGHWDPMDEDWGPTNDFMGWHKWKMGWLAPGQVHCAPAGGPPTEHVLTPISTPGGTKIVVLPTGPHSAFVVEARASGLLDPIVCRPGVLVYHVATNVPSGRAPIRVIDGTPHSDGCYTDDRYVDADLTDATFRPGETYTDHISGVSVTVLTENADGTYRVRTTPARTPLPISLPLPPSAGGRY